MMTKNSARISNTPVLTKDVLEEIIRSLSNIRGWGSVEIFIQNHKVTQVIEKNIVKPTYPTE